MHSPANSFLEDQTSQKSSFSRQKHFLRVVSRYTLKWFYTQSAFSSSIYCQSKGQFMGLKRKKYSRIRSYPPAIHCFCATSMQIASFDNEWNLIINRKHPSHVKWWFKELLSMSSDHIHPVVSNVVPQSFQDFYFCKIGSKL